MEIEKNELIELWYEKLGRFNEEIAFLSYVKKDKKFRKQFGIPLRGLQDSATALTRYVDNLGKNKVKQKKFIEELLKIARFLGFKRDNEVKMLQKYLLDGQYPVQFIPDYSRFRKKKRHENEELWIRVDRLHVEEIFEDIQLLVGLYPTLIDSSPIGQSPGKRVNIIPQHMVYELHKRFSDKELADHLANKMNELAEHYEEIVDEKDPVQKDSFFDLPEMTVENIKKIKARYKKRMEVKKKKKPKEPFRSASPASSSR